VVKSLRLAVAADYPEDCPKVLAVKLTKKDWSLLGVHHTRKYIVVLTYRASQALNSQVNLAYLPSQIQEMWSPTWFPSGRRETGAEIRDFL